MRRGLGNSSRSLSAPPHVRSWIAAQAPRVAKDLASPARQPSMRVRRASRTAESVDQHVRGSQLRPHPARYWLATLSFCAPDTRGSGVAARRGRGRDVSRAGRRVFPRFPASVGLSPCAMSTSACCILSVRPLLPRARTAHKAVSGCRVIRLTVICPGIACASWDGSDPFGVKARVDAAISRARAPPNSSYTRELQTQNSHRARGLRAPSPAHIPGRLRGRR